MSLSFRFSRLNAFVYVNWAHRKKASRAAQALIPASGQACVQVATPALIAAKLGY